MPLWSFWGDSFVCHRVFFPPTLFSLFQPLFTGHFSSVLVALLSCAQTWRCQLRLYLCSDKITCFVRHNSLSGAFQQGISLLEETLHVWVQISRHKSCCAAQLISQLLASIFSISTFFSPTDELLCIALHRISPYYYKFFIQELFEILTCTSFLSLWLLQPHLTSYQHFKLYFLLLHSDYHHD